MLPSSFLSGGGPAFLGLPAKNKTKNSFYQKYSNKRLVSLLRTRNEALPNRYNLKDPTFATVFKSLRFRRRFEDTYCSNTHKHIKKGLRFQKKNTVASMGPLQNKERKKNSI